MRGMPELHHTAVDARPMWIGHTLVLREAEPDVRRSYQYEGDLPQPVRLDPPAQQPRRFTLRRAFGAAG